MMFLSVRHRRGEVEGGGGGVHMTYRSGYANKFRDLSPPRVLRLRLVLSSTDLVHSCCVYGYGSY